MNFDLRELYQEVIIDHNRNPRNHHMMEDATAKANGFNPLCGDKLTVYLKLDHNVIQDISFKGQGCAISQASASLMTEALLGKTQTEAEALFQSMHHLLTEECGETPPKVGKLAVLLGVRAYPARVKCATLAWHTLHAAMQHDSSIVKTE